MLALYKASGNAVLTIDNTGNGNASGIDFVRQRSTGPDVGGGSIFMNSDTSGTNALLYIQAQTSGAPSGVTGALTAANGSRIILRGGTGVTSFENGATESMRIDNAGNVGIGTVSPGAKLEVAGQVKITGGTPGAGKVLTSDASGLATWTIPAATGVTSLTAGTGLTGGTITTTGTIAADTTYRL